MTKRLFKGSRRARLVQFAAGLAALFILVTRIREAGQAHTSPIANAFIWGTTFLATILLVWRERNQTIISRKAGEEHARFIAAAETSPDAFLILDSIRNSGGDIVDFRYVYANAHAEDLLKTPRKDLLKQNMCVLFPRIAPMVFLISIAGW